MTSQILLELIFHHVSFTLINVRCAIVSVVILKEPCVQCECVCDRIQRDDLLPVQDSPLTR